MVTRVNALPLVRRTCIKVGMDSAAKEFAHGCVSSRLKGRGSAQKDEPRENAEGELARARRICIPKAIGIAKSQIGLVRG